MADAEPIPVEAPVEPPAAPVDRFPDAIDVYAEGIYYRDPAQVDDLRWSLAIGGHGRFRRVIGPLGGDADVQIGAASGLLLGARVGWDASVAAGPLLFDVGAAGSYNRAGSHVPGAIGFPVFTEIRLQGDPMSFGVIAEATWMSGAARQADRGPGDERRLAIELCVRDRVVIDLGWLQRMESEAWEIRVGWRLPR